jgi:hypothetical protein
MPPCTDPGAAPRNWRLLLDDLESHQAVEWGLKEPTELLCERIFVFAQ